ncbi:MAG: hypothetical protein QM204_03505 [Bacillota bacterium]|jgi:hypothetical protein|nr:hypothetical protein [Bacillota bacterium]NLL26406.1 hypothetical protein [Erysipelotrichia bacterium]
MIKRIIFYVLVLTLIFFGVYKVYQSYKPKETENPVIEINYEFDIVLTIEDFNELIISSEEPLNVIFFDSSSINSQYLFNTILTEIMINNEIEKIENLIYVNLVDFDISEYSSFRLKYGFSSVPACANMSYSEGLIVVNNIIEESNNNILTIQMVQDWLVKNNLIKLKE